MHDQAPVPCQACGVVTDQLAELTTELAIARENHRNARAARQRLEDEMAGSQEADPRYARAVEVLTYWQRTVMPSAREPLAKPRVKAVLARLKGGYTTDELCEAIDGYGRFPFMIRGRRSAWGDQTNRAVDAELIFKAPQNVDRGVAMAHANGQGSPSPAAIAKVPWHKVWHENRRLILQALQRLYKQGIDDGTGAGRTLFPCPQCQAAHPDPPGQEPLSLTVFSEVGFRIVECVVCNLNDDRLLAAVTDAEGLLT